MKKQETEKVEIRLKQTATKAIHGFCSMRIEWLGLRTTKDGADRDQPEAAEMAEMLRTLIPLLEDPSWVPNPCS